jgi:hypothetical protein
MIGHDASNQFSTMDAVCLPLQAVEKLEEERRCFLIVRQKETRLRRLVHATCLRQGAILACNKPNQSGRR